MLKETGGHLLPFLFSIASNGTRGFLMFPSSVKEFLQMQYQTILDQCTEQNSWKLHLTHYLFSCVNTVILMNTKKNSEFHSSKLAILSQVKWMEISSSLISRSPYEENQDKKSLFGPKGNNL